MEISSINSCHGLTALPPWAQKEREIDAILQDPRLKELLSKIGNPNAIDASRFTIQNNGDIEYIVKTDSDYIIRVHLTYCERPERNYGPKHFTLKFFEPEIPPHYCTGLLTR